MNYGKKVNGVVNMTLGTAIALLTNLRNSGNVFRVDFLKKDDSLRTMVCRFGVKKFANGKGMSYSPVEKGLVTVYEFGVGYRTVNLDRIVLIKHGGTVYNFAQMSMAAAEANRVEYGINPEALSPRTVRAETSPMYV
jgi:hypothetical protein